MTKDELMTEEQIKHNAERYANRYEIRGTSDGEFRYIDKKDAYIAGAHSRDEEVLKLLKSQENIDEKPSNQWISVKDRLPKKKDGKIRSDVVLVTLGQSWTVAEYHFGDKRWINLLGERETIEPEYWKEVNLPVE
jgi:hypothetical protein